MKTFNGKITDGEVYFNGEKFNVVNDSTLESNGKYYRLGPLGSLVEVVTSTDLTINQEEFEKELEDLDKLFNHPINYEVQDVSNINEVIEESFSKIAKIKKSLKYTTDKIKKATLLTESAGSRKVRFAFNKGTIEELQTAVISIADAEQALAITQKVTLEYQKVITDFCRYLLFLGTSNIATNRAIVSTIQSKLSKASEKELSQEEKNELLVVIKELKNQQTIHDEQEQLKLKIKLLDTKVNDLENEIVCLKTGEIKVQPQDRVNENVVKTEMVKEETKSNPYKGFLIAFIIIIGVLLSVISFLIYVLFGKIQLF